MAKYLSKTRLKEGNYSPLKNNFKTSHFWGKTKLKSLKCNLQEPQLKSEGVSLGALVQKCEENSL